MKVIKEGKRRNVVQVTCSNCHSILEVTRDDIQIISCRGGGVEYSYECPVCGKVDINKELNQLFEYYVDS